MEIVACFPPAFSLSIANHVCEGPTPRYTTSHYLSCHTRTIASSPAEAIRLSPFKDVHAMLLTLLLCSRYVHSVVPSKAFHICAVLSTLAEAIRLPSGDQLTAFTSALLW